MTETAGTYITAANTSDSPVVVDGAGRTIEAHGFGTVDPTRAPARTLLEGGILLESQRPRGVSDDDLNPAAVRAYAATEQRNAGDDAATVAAAQTDAELAAAGEDDEADETPTTPARKRTARS